MSPFTIIADVEEKFAPAESPVLSVSVIDDVAFLSIGTYEETHDRTAVITKMSVAVEVSTLMNVLSVGRVAEHASARRQRLAAPASPTEEPR